VIVDVQRGGPSTGLPTKPEQSDLLQALYGRNGDAPLPVLAARTPGDCFEAAYEACRIAVKYMTPVILLADGYLGNGSASWRIPDVRALTDFEIPRATTLTDRNSHRDGDGEQQFLPYLRDEATLARPWAAPGTKDLEHRLGGLEKEHETGNVSYDPQNHQFMTKLRAEKVARVAQEIPPTTPYGDDAGDVLVLGWGSTEGAIEVAIDQLRAEGVAASAVCLRHLHPLPPDLEAVMDRFEHVVVPELNNGQLVRVLRERFLRAVTPLSKVQGRPFRAEEIATFVKDACGMTSGA
jgi:2-oxoglutarate ferredoxin oxidoreductase subunit alpha